MDQLRFVETQFRIEHRHADGKDAPMEEVREHGSVEHDPERRWGLGRIFRCTRCDETVTVVPGTEGGPAPER
jgi:hypothetical protein